MPTVATGVETMLSRFFKKEKSNVKTQAPKSRKLRMASLEDRALLSVAPFEYAEIRALYPAFALPENRAEINVIDLAAATTSQPTAPRSTTFGSRRTSKPTVRRGDTSPD